MIKLVFCIHRNPALSHEEFCDYWLNQHGPLVKSRMKHLGACRYVQSHAINHMIGDQGNKIRGSKAQPYDGITELWWHSDEDFSPAGSSREDLIATQKALLADESKFIDLERSVIIMTEEHEIF